MRLSKQRNVAVKAALTALQDDQTLTPEQRLEFAKLLLENEKQEQDHREAARVRRATERGFARQLELLERQQVHRIELLKAEREAVHLSAEQLVKSALEKAGIV